MFFIGKLMFLSYKQTDVTVLPRLVAVLAVTRVDDNTVTADTREVHTTVITTYLSDRAQHPELRHQKTLSNFITPVFTAFYLTTILPLVPAITVCTL